MLWIAPMIVCVVLVLAIAAWVGSVRFNSLCLARDLCKEALRQLGAVCRERHVVVSSVVCVLRENGRAADADALAAVLARAERARRAAVDGPCTAECAQELSAAESALSNTLVALLGEGSGTRAEAPAAGFVPQLGALEVRLAAAARYYNHSVHAYSSRRNRPLSFVFRAHFPVMPVLRYRSAGALTVIGAHT